MLPPRSLLVLMDFTSFSLDPPKTGSKEQVIYVQDCIVVLEYLADDGKRQLEYLDFLCGCPSTNKNDYFFVLNVWLKLFLLKDLASRFDRIDIWTDGGPHHFKTRYCQWMWHFLSSSRFGGKRIAHHFFTSYHGHSLADAHAATGKRLLRNALHASEQQRAALSEADPYWGPGSAADLAHLLCSQASHTEAIHLPSIHRDEGTKPDVLPLRDLKQYHSFVYEANACREFDRSNDGAGYPFSFTFLT